jgi:hypothetical protein
MIASPAPEEKTGLFLEDRERITPESVYEKGSDPLSKAVLFP